VIRLGVSEFPDTVMIEIARFVPDRAACALSGDLNDACSAGVLRQRPTLISNCCPVGKRTGLRTSVAVGFLCGSRGPSRLIFRPVDPKLREVTTSGVDTRTAERHRNWSSFPTNEPTTKSS
jgi:hypothetical protein